VNTSEDAVEGLGFARGGTENVGLPVLGVPTEDLNVNLIGGGGAEKYECYNRTGYVRGSNGKRNFPISFGVIKRNVLAGANVTIADERSYRKEYVEFKVEPSPSLSFVLPLADCKTGPTGGLSARFTPPPGFIL
jgi:hypothetical protein